MTRKIREITEGVLTLVVVAAALTAALVYVLDVDAGLISISGGRGVPPAVEDDRTEASLWPNGSQTAADCNQSSVQTAVNNASDGQRVLIPSGSCSWTTGITTTKQILIRAQTYTPTDGGSSSRSVTITNNSSGGPLLTMTSGGTYHVGVAGIRFNNGTATTNYVRFASSSGSKVPLLSDVYMEIRDNAEGTATDIALLVWLAQGGVIWNSQFVNVSGDGQNFGASFLIQSPRAWATASTIGTLDTDGSVNVYFEDNYAKDVGQFPDVDSNGRIVMRYSSLDGAWGTVHGFSGPQGRQVEYYNNTFSVTNVDRNMAQRYVWIRAGTAAFHDNTVNSAVSGEWGVMDQLDLGEVGEIPGTYLYDRQPGSGHNGSAYISEPIYMWDESGARAYTSRVQADWTSHIVANRDFFPADGGPNPGAKPGYAAYEYPHPLRYAP